MKPEQFRDAAWIWTEGETRKPFHFAWFRATFNGAVGGRGDLLISADSKYRLWVNGTYLGFGPPRGHRDHPYFDHYSIKLRKGRNVIAVLVEHYSSGIQLFAPVQGGFISEVFDAKGRTLCASGMNWKALTSSAHTPIAGILLAESFDARQEPDGWQKPTFDDASWPMAVCPVPCALAAPSAMLPRPIAQIVERERRPATVLDAGCCVDEQTPDVAGAGDVAASLWRSKLMPLAADALSPALRAHTAWTGRRLTIRPPRGDVAVYLMIDMGLATLGSLEITARGPAGAILDFGYSEKLERDRVACMRQDQAYCDRMILREGVTTYRLMQPRGFRYLMLRVSGVGGPVVLEKLSVHESIYPVPTTGRFFCSDPTLERIYKLCTRTVNLCMEDSFTDCIWRERSQWLGDLQPEALANYFCFGAYDLARKAVLEYAHGNTVEGWLPAAFPVSHVFNIPAWGLRYPVIVRDYLLFTGDTDAATQCWAAVEKQLAWQATLESADGLLENLPEWMFLDWTRLDCGWNVKGSPMGALQGWYLEALRAAAELADMLAHTQAGAAYRRKAERLAKNIPKAYWSAKRGAYLKFNRAFKGEGLEKLPPDVIGQHEAFILAWLKVGSAAMRKRALAAVRGESGKWLPSLGTYQMHVAANGPQGNTLNEEIIRLGTPFWSDYAIRALMEAGLESEAVDYIRICWGLMLDQGATSCWETWDGNASLCHGWSAAPATALPRYVLGVRPTSPGFKTFDVEPHTGDLDFASGSVPTPLGTIQLGWKKMKTGLITISLTVPTGARATIRPPRGFSGASKFFGPGRHRVQFAHRRA